MHFLILYTYFVWLDIQQSFENLVKKEKVKWIKCMNHSCLNPYIDLQFFIRAQILKNGIQIKYIDFICNLIVY